MLFDTARNRTRRNTKMPRKIQYGKPGTWNYRVLRHDDDGPDPVLGIHEVHYTEEGISPTEQPIIVGQDIAELLRVIDQLSDALKKSIIDIRNQKT